MRKRHHISNVIIATLLAVSIGVGLLIYGQSLKESPTQKAELMREISQGSGLAGEEGVLTAELRDVAGGDSVGAANLLRKDNTLTLEILAKMQDPEEGQFYEGWLVQKLPTTKLLSAGSLEKAEEGTYKLVHTANADYPTYNFVIVSIETIKDDIIETHILEGSLVY